MKKSPEQKKSFRNRFIVESIVIVLIILSPFLFKLHEYLPNDPEATIQFLGLIFDRNGFLDLNTYGWFMLGKIVPLLLLAIWFLTCKHWWYHIIIIPMMMYAFQIFETLYSSDKYIDTKNVLWLLPVCMIVISIVYLIRIKLYDKYVHGIDLDAINNEITILKEKQGSLKGNKEVAKVEKATHPKKIGYRSLTEKVNEKFSSRKVEAYFGQFQNQMGEWLH